MQQQRHFVCAVTVHGAAMCEQGERLSHHLILAYICKATTAIVVNSLIKYNSTPIGCGFTPWQPGCFRADVELTVSKIVAR